jgi:uncharacterized protein YjbI with pentapeptide repeats
LRPDLPARFGSIFSAIGGARIPNEIKESVCYPILRLEGIDFSGAIFDQSVEVDLADLSCANLSNTDLSGATLRGVNLHGADLSGANLSKTKLLRANLWEVEPHEERVGPLDELLKMDLSRANLQGANLTGANLQDAKLTDNQLTAALSLKGATMPNGSKHF